MLKFDPLAKSARARATDILAKKKRFFAVTFCVVVRFNSNTHQNFRLCTPDLSTSVSKRFEITLSDEIQKNVHVVLKLNVCPNWVTPPIDRNSTIFRT